MVQLTEAAARELKRIKDRAREQKSDSIPRLVPMPEGGFNLTLQAPEEGDDELYFADDTVLAVDPEAGRVLADVTLDYVVTPQGRRFVFVGDRTA